MGEPHGKRSFKRALHRFKACAPIFDGAGRRGRADRAKPSRGRGRSPRLDLSSKHFGTCINIVGLVVLIAVSFLTPVFRLSVFDPGLRSWS